MCFDLDTHLISLATAHSNNSDSSRSVLFFTVPVSQIHTPRSFPDSNSSDLVGYFQQVNIFCWRSNVVQSWNPSHPHSQPEFPLTCPISSQLLGHKCHFFSPKRLFWHAKVFFALILKNEVCRLSVSVELLQRTRIQLSVNFPSLCSKEPLWESTWERKREINVQMCF